MERNVALIIPAAGSGSRMGLGHNKLFAMLDGVPLIRHTLDSFRQSGRVREVLLAVRPEEAAEVLEALSGEAYPFAVRTAPGGNTRQASVLNALRGVSEDVERVWIHDGARPFISEAVLARLSALESGQRGQVVAVPAKDTIKRVDVGLAVVETLKRSELWQVQTPQAFWKRDLLEANRLAEAAGFEGTDDASLAEWAGYPVHVVEGDYFNIKITTPEDLVLAEAILAYRKGGTRCG